MEKSSRVGVNEEGDGTWTPFMDNTTSSSPEKDSVPGVGVGWCMRDMRGLDWTRGLSKFYPLYKESWDFKVVAYYLQECGNYESVVCLDPETQEIVGVGHMQIRIYPDTGAREARLYGLQTRPPGRTPILLAMVDWLKKKGEEDPHFCEEFYWEDGVDPQLVKFATVEHRTLLRLR
jgi:hypothetical protein